jgi:hypothetical protein
VKLRCFAILVLVIASLVITIWVVSPAAIIPPENILNPVNIYLVDYGFHARLILPIGKDKCVEYAYGDWQYFALNQQDWLTGAAALLLPTQGALGRKFTKCDRFSNFLIAVEKTKVARLQKLLNSSFDRHASMQIENPHTGMTLVPYDRTYTLLHNSNHELVRWLEDLGCRVEGFVLWANFKLGSRE